MKPDWDELAEALVDDPAVFIADVNCSNEEDMCRQNDVSGYPAIKVWKDGRVQDYRGGRSMEDLMEFVHESCRKSATSSRVHMCVQKGNKHMQPSGRTRIHRQTKPKWID
jgi:thioredoxin-like negative regulator of GroEL